jgi:flagella basal body P-ring formation protein FlgA
MRDFPITHTRNDTITDATQLVGKSPVLAISPSRPVRQHEIASPAIVKKNSIVSMRFTSPGMEITATGQAMEEGAKGDVINVRNTVSRKIVRAVIADANTVDIKGIGEDHAAN